jgi:hypothetical protein
MSQQIYSLPRLTASVPYRHPLYNHPQADRLMRIWSRGEFRTELLKVRRLQHAFKGVFSTRAGEGTRTPNLLITNQLLYQLSYASNDPAAPITGPQETQS